MRYPTKILALLSIFSASFIAPLGASDGTFGANITPITPRSQPDIMLKKLSVIIQNYKAAPDAPLSSQDVADLTTFASDSIGATYDSLSKADRASLSQIINLNADQFSPSVVTKFNADQKLAARMSTQDIEAIKSIVVDIRDGKALSDRQVSDLRDFKMMISKDPYAFIVELNFITQYVTLNSDKFNSSDLDVFRQASRDATGISSADLSALNAIASRGNTNLNRDDIAVLKSLEVRAPIGALNGMDPGTVVALSQVINANSSSFPADFVSNFNTAYNNNQAVQYYVAEPHGSVNDKSNPAPGTVPPTSAAQR